ncbi:Bet v1-like protein [Atractiella rhizophila]|nr:Bet v1-like protein [Atractiella rhizophila]
MQTSGSPQWKDETAVPDYPMLGKHIDALQAAKKLVLEEIDSKEGWEDQGERDGVHYYRKDDPTDAYAVPFVKGVCEVPDCTTDDYLAVLQLEGMRKTWDDRLEEGKMVERYRLRSFAFYSVMKGFGWLVWPRDIFGAQIVEREGPNGRIHVIQTSVIDKETLPEQSGKQRADLKGALWRLTPNGSGITVEYLVRISLGGSLPTAIVSQLANELPGCTGRAKNTLAKFGHAPYARAVGGEEKELDVIFNAERITTPDPTKGSDSRHWVSICKGTSKATTFEVVYSKKMYPDGVTPSSTDERVKIDDDGQGKLTVQVPGEVDGRFDINVVPK